MEHLYLPPSLRYFRPLRIERGGCGMHACFEYDLVAARRPGMVVDLGSDDAMSFSVFCQSMRDHDVDGLAYAIDEWESDAQREADGKTTQTSINNFLHSNFRGQAYLLEQGPEKALVHFADGSIDLLRIDFGRIKLRFQSILDSWWPKLAPNGVFLCKGVAERADVFEDWKRRMPHAPTFRSGGGLGATVRDPSPAANDSLLSWLSTDDDSVHERWIAFYDHAALHHMLRIEIQNHQGALYRKRS